MKDKPASQSHRGFFLKFLNGDYGLSAAFFGFGLILLLGLIAIFWAWENNRELLRVILPATLLYAIFWAAGVGSAAGGGKNPLEAHKNPPGCAFVFVLLAIVIVLFLGALTYFLFFFFPFYFP